MHDGDEQSHSDADIPKRLGTEMRDCFYTRLFIANPSTDGPERPGG